MADVSKQVSADRSPRGHYVCEGCRHPLAGWTLHAGNHGVGPDGAECVALSCNVSGHRVPRSGFFSRSRSRSRSRRRSRSRSRSRRRRRSLNNRRTIVTPRTRRDGRAWPILVALWWALLACVVVLLLSMLNGCGSVELVALDGGAALSDPVSSPDGAAEQHERPELRADARVDSVTDSAGLDVERADRIDTEVGSSVQDTGAEAIPGCSPGGLYEGPTGLTPCP